MVLPELAHQDWSGGQLTACFPSAKRARGLRILLKACSYFGQRDPAHPGKGNAAIRAALGVVSLELAHYLWRSGGQPTAWVFLGQVSP
eukprot:4107400-Alexandrium_andersonii.AAC.1